ncbi:MAG: hypothetical protein N3A64_04580 [Desulfobacterota bacterium]|nr:hypothetical protein [Thermodesulfobacteriota bacterium]
MKKRSQVLIRLSTILILLCSLVPWGCDSTKKYLGTYKEVTEASVSPEAMIKLREDGQGIWTIKGKEVSFRWSVKDLEIRFHTREGGVITGKIVGDSITLALPGNKVILFKKIAPY